MRKVKVLIIDSSYIITQGLQHVLNDIVEISYFSINEYQEELIDFIYDYNPDILFFHNNYFNKLNEYIKETNQIYILIGEKNNLIHQYYINLINDDKSNIISTIRNVIIENFNEETNLKSSELSEREKSVINLVASGFTNKEIADKLFLSKHTVITHRKNITNKLNIKTVSGLTVYAILNNIVDIKDIS